MRREYFFWLGVICARHQLQHPQYHTFERGSWQSLAYLDGYTCPESELNHLPVTEDQRLALAHVRNYIE